MNRIDMVRPYLRLAIVWLVLLVSSGFVRGDDLRCVVCGKAIVGRYFWIASPALAEKQSVCDDCSKIESRCVICRLPVNSSGHHLPDGRDLCAKDFKDGIFDEREVQRVYESTRRDLQGILAGTGVLPERNITVTMADANQLKKLNQSLPSAHDDANIQGLTRSRVRNKTEFEHDILLISGLGPARLAAVAAHEYTHTWIHENVPAERRLERDTIEGFCELVAYKLMSQRGEETEKRVILANAYTRGQVNAFVQAESEHQFHRVVRWMKTGVDEILTEANPKQVLATRAVPSEPLWPPPKQRPTRVPDQLELRGISGRPGRRYALVNNCTVVAGDEARIRVAQTAVDVRCLEVREESVVLQVIGQDKPIELFMRPGRVFRTASAP